jgi:magnesium transporter
MKSRAGKRGLPPGSLVHIGDKKSGDVNKTLIVYDDVLFQETALNKIEQCSPFKNKSSVSWINIDGLNQTDLIQKVGEFYNLHSLVIEDVLNTDQRPKIEDYKEYLYIVLKMLNNSSNNTFTVEQVSLVVGKNFVITFQEGLEGDVFNPIRERLRSGKGRIRSESADFLAYSIIDAIVDNYFTIVEKLGEKIEDLEGELITLPTQDTLRKIHELKRETIFLRKAVWPLREVISFLKMEVSPLIKDTTKPFLQDVNDHTIQVMDIVEISREMLSGMLDVYLSGISNKMNEIMKFLTIIGTIFMPLTFIAGIYGMNFEFMPEVKWKSGYFIVLFLMLSLGISMIFYFKKKKWL